MPNACPSEEEVACFVEGLADPPAAQRLLAHLDVCGLCRVLLASSLRADETPPTGDLAGRVPRTFRVGSVVGARYRIDRFLAQGGMGEVYAAWDLELDEAVALKTLACTGLDHAGLSVRMRAEVQMARRVNHPNVCRILEFGVHRHRYRGQQEAIPFFTMDFLAGQTLATLVAQGGRLTELEATAIGSDVLDGLAAIHEAGIIHRDLKPENIFLVARANGRPRAVVMDFGLARFTDVQSSVSSSTGDGPLGTPAYMAPEQALGGTPSTAWDIYAFGVVLFRSITGELPFKGNTSEALAVARLHQVAPRLSSLVPGVNPALGAIVARCLERDPTHRFSSVADLRYAFAATHRPSARRRVRPLLLNAFTLLLLAFGTAALLARSRGSQSRGAETGTALHVAAGAASTGARQSLPATPAASSAIGQLASPSPEVCPPSLLVGRSARPAPARRSGLRPASSAGPAAAPRQVVESAEDDEVVVPAFAGKPPPPDPEGS